MTIFTVKRRPAAAQGVTSLARGWVRRSIVAMSVIAVAVGSAALPAAAGTVAAAPVGALAGAAGSTSYLPFDLPSTASLRSSPKKVFVHYVPWSPISYDNKLGSVDYYAKNYLTPGGEGGKYAAFGGKQRDRPIERAPIVGDPDWQIRDMETEVRQAISAGIDGFVVSLVSFGDTQTANAVKDLMQAAINVDPGFEIMLRPNMISPSVMDLPVAALAKNLADLAKFSSAYRLADNRLVLSPFKADADTVAWWQSLFTIMKSTYNIDVAFWPMFLNEMANGPAFADISYGMANWGDRTASNNNPLSTSATSKIGRIAAVQARGDKWMQPVSLQDARPAQSIFYEPHNTTNLRNTWKIAIDGGADMVHIPTWNDFAEGSQIGPSAKLGWTALDLNSYYLTWYKTGREPTIVRDTVYLSHRTMPSTATGTAQSPMKALSGTMLYDQVEATTFLTAPGTVTIGVGSKRYTFQAGAGEQTFYAPLGTGVVSAKVTRNGVLAAGTTSSHPVVTNPAIQDMDYVGASSGRTPTAGPTTTGDETFEPQSFVVPSIADTYVQGLAATSNTGGSSSVVSNGTYAANAYLRFALPTTPEGTTLTKAELQFWVATNATAGSAASHSLTLASNSWDEMTVNWNTRPALIGGSIGTIRGATSLDTPYKATLNAAALASAAGNPVSLAVTSTGTDELRFWSSEFAAEDRRPELLLTYTHASPTTPSTPAPTTPAPTTPAPTTPAPTTPAPTTPGSATLAPAPATLAPTTPASVTPRTFEVEPSADTYTQGLAATTNTGASASVVSNGTYAANAYLRFALPAAPAGTRLTGAAFRFWVATNDTAGSAAPHSITLASNTWNEMSVNWNTRPALVGSALGTIRGATSLDTEYQTSLNAAALASAAGSQITLAVTSTGTDELRFWSKDFVVPARRPHLVLTYS